MSRLIPTGVRRRDGRMGSFPAGDLRETGWTHAGPWCVCAGCGRTIDADELAYATWRHIWHEGCWPRVRYRCCPLASLVEDGVGAP